jgi:hypothetical protein
MIRLLDWGSCLPYFDYSNRVDYGGLLLLGNLPDGSQKGIHTHQLITHEKSLHMHYVSFTPIHKCKKRNFNGLLRLDKLFGYPRLHQLNIDTKYGVECEPNDWFIESKNLPLTLGFGSGYKGTCHNFGMYCFDQNAVNKAYIKARSARFEHGE